MEITFCMKCDPARFDTEFAEATLPSAAAICKKFCARHGRRLKAVKAQIKEAIAKEAEEAE